jgi:hypothetical protein
LTKINISGKNDIFRAFPKTEVLGKALNTGDVNRIKAMLPLLNERHKKLFLTDDARSIGYGRVSQVSRIS